MYVHVVGTYVRKYAYMQTYTQASIQTFTYNTRKYTYTNTYTHTEAPPTHTLMYMYTHTLTIGPSLGHPSLWGALGQACSTRGEENKDYETTTAV